MVHSTPRKSELPPLIENDVLSRAVHGRRLRGARFEEALSPQGSLVVFLRHFGCTFCRKMVNELREASRSPNFPDVVFVHQGSVKAGEEFFAKHWPEAAAIADPDLKLYRAFGLARGNAFQLFGPGALLSGLKGLTEGHGIGRPMGDPLLMPGLFFVKGNEVLWSHEFRHAGDHPDFKTLSF